MVVNFSKSLEALEQSHQGEVLESIRDIFFNASTRKTFKNINEKEEFYYTWLGQYLEKYPDFTFLAIDENCQGKNNQNVIGYITCCPNTGDDWSKLNQPSLTHWTDQYQNYPAHLHINCAEAARGKGIGSKLCQALEEKLIENRVRGLHLVTAEGSRNVSFYKKLGFKPLKSHPFDESLTFLLLGKNLSS